MADIKEVGSDLKLIAKLIANDVKEGVKNLNKGRTRSSMPKIKGFKTMFKESMEKSGIKEGSKGMKSTIDDLRSDWQSIKKKQYYTPPPEQPKQERTDYAPPVEEQPPTKSREYYLKVLGLPNNASNEAIKAQFQKLAMLYHPDKIGASGASQVFREIKEAKDALLK